MSDNDSLQQYKITGGDVSQKGVIAAPDKLTGPAAENKALFDRLVREAVAERHNDLIDALDAALAGKQDALTFDTTPTAGSTNPVTSGGIKTALDAKQDTLTTAQLAAVNSGANSTNIAQIGTNATAISGIKDGANIDSFADVETALDGKQDAINAANGTGTNSLVLGDVQHNSAEGEGSIAAGVGCSTGDHAHGSLALGHGTVAGSVDQLVFGRYNKPDTENKYTEIVGNGAGLGRTSNARTLDRQGNETLAGKLTFGALPTGAMDAVPLCMVPRPNLLDNAYFVGGGSQQGRGQFPINQRGGGTSQQTIYSGDTTYFDRWRGSANISAIIEEDGVTISSSAASGGVSFSQRMSLEPLLGKTVTGSVLTADGTLYTGTGTLPSTVPTSGNTYAFSVDTSVGGFQLAYVSARQTLEFTLTLPGAGRSIKLAAAKLEEGETQTLCRNVGTTASPVWVLNETPDYATELMKCQRYLYVFNKAKRRYTIVALGMASDSTNCSFLFSVPQEMKTTSSQPTLSYSGAFRIVDPVSGGTRIGVTGMTMDVDSFNGKDGAIVATVNSGLTQRNMYFLQTNNDANAKIIISSEP